MKRILLCVLILLSAMFVVNISSSDAFELNGFADVSFTKSTEGDNRTDDEYRNGDFAFGTLDLYLAQTVDDIDILVELIVEKGNVLDLERLSIGYTFSDEVKLRVGRFHTPIGFWNTAYHHGVQLQPTIERPDFLKFEDDGGIIPAHVVGASLFGRVNTGAGAVDYSVLIGNGPMIETVEGVLSPNNISDNNVGKAVAFNAAISPSVVEGLKVGVSGHISEILSNDVPMTVNVDQTIYAFAVTYAKGPLDLAAEYFTFNDKNELSTSSTYGDEFDNNAYYGLITYTLMEKWVPYVMYENLSVEEADPYMDALEIGKDTEELTVGLRYNINYRSSVKGEYRNIIDEGGADWSEVAFQWALAF